MRPLFRVVLIAAVLVLPGCRQSDGDVPVPNADAQGEIRDISRDILNIASGSDPQAPKDLTDDLLRYTMDKRTQANDAVMDLARQTAEALAGRTVPEQAAQQLAHHFWVAVTARELNERQIEILQSDVQALFGSVGVPEGQASSVAAQVGDVQQLATDRTRRWYEVF